jgi:hypothetical protein
VQGAMESPHQGISYLGKRRRVEGRVFKFLFRFGCQGRSFLSRVPCQDFRDVRQSYAKKEDQDVQGAMESLHRGQSYLGKRRRVEGRVSKFLF